MNIGRSQTLFIRGIYEEDYKDINPI